MATAPELHRTRYTGPPFEDARVYDAMRVGMITCRPETSLRDVAQMMSSYGVHAVVVQDVGAGNRPWGIVTALDLASAAGSDLSELKARDVASSDLVTVHTDESLAGAAKLMTDHSVTHLVAVDQVDWPCGVISAGGLAAALAAAR